MNRTLLLLSIASLCLKLVICHKHTFSIETKKSFLPIGKPFGVSADGHFALEIQAFEHTLTRKWFPNMRKKKKSEGDIKDSKYEAAFFLKRFANEAEFTKFVDGIQMGLRSNTSTCVFDYDIEDDPLEDFDVDASVYDEIHPDSADEVLLSMNGKHKKQISYTFKSNEEGLYFLMYQICPHITTVKSKFELEIHWFNIDAFGRKTYLPVGEVHLPIMFLFFGFSYFLCFLVWAINIAKIQRKGKGLFDHPSDGNGRPVVYAIHQLMSFLMCLKTISIIAESYRYHLISVNEYADVWSFVYYTINFVKGTFLFTVMLLIGSGWSFVKPFLSSREKKIILVVLVLQVVNNLCLGILSQEIEGEKGYDRLTAIMRLVDIVCCCVVLVPVVWQVNALEQTIVKDGDMESNPKGFESEYGEETQTLSKLRLFRTFYLMVIGYTYSTRILIYLFVTVLDYRHIWLRHLVVEIVTLTFYVVVGLMFRPMPHNPYLSLKGDEVGEPALKPETELTNRSSNED